MTQCSGPINGDTGRVCVNAIDSLPCSECPSSNSNVNICGEFVWDGPYRMICGRHIVNGECLMHGANVTAVLL